MGSFRLYIHLPGPAEFVVIVDKQAAHVRLNCVVNIGQSNALFQHLLLVHLDELLWDAGYECSEDRADLRTLASGGKEFSEVVSKKWDVSAGAVLEDKRNTSRSADARNRRRREAERRPCRQILELLVQTCLDGLILFRSALSLVPGFQ